MKLRYWFIRETEKARLYSTTNPKVSGRDVNEVWIPKSVIEHTSKRGDEHTIDLPDWFVEKEGL